MPAPTPVNIAGQLRESAERYPFQRAVVFPAGRDHAGRVTYAHLTFRQLDEESDRLARGFRRLGVVPGTRLVLMVRPSLEFIALTFALFKVGAVVVLIDPGMGRAGVLKCLDQVEPQGFVALPLVQALRRLLAKRFPQARINVSVGPGFSLGAKTYPELLGEAWEPFPMAPSTSTDPAAVIFTSGSTGPAKGVLYEHGMFQAQVELIRDHYGIRPGEIDLPGFPLFALFNSAMGVTTVIPDMDPTRPARVDPAKMIEAIDNHGITQAFGSPAIWNRIGRHCEPLALSFPTLKRVLSAGAPVPPHVLRRMRQTFVSEDSDIATPYGATEALPVCSITGKEVLNGTVAKTNRGAGTCVGKPFPRIEVKIIEITSAPVSSLREVRELPPGEIGEIVVCGPVVTREYFRQPEATRMAKIPDGETFWHRMGDVGYLDEEGSLWFCGRKAHIVETPHGRMFTDCCEAIFNEHPAVYRSALVGVGEKPRQTPVIVAEPESGKFPRSNADIERFRRELRALAQVNPLTQHIDTFLLHPALPVDTRHNVKISREKLAVWASRQLR